MINDLYSSGNNDIYNTGYDLAASNENRPALATYNTRQLLDKKILYQDKAVMYAAGLSTVNHGLMYRTADYGDTWTNVGDVGSANAEELIVSSTNPAIMIATTTDAKIYRSIDTGATWALVKTLNATPVFPANLCALPNGNFLVGEYSIDKTKVHNVWLSTDNGSTWTSVLESHPFGTPGRDPLECGSDSNSGHVHFVQYDRHSGKIVAFVDYSYPELWVSDDNGATFTLLAQGTTSNFPNTVGLCFSKNYIGWASDLGAHGEIFRIARADFYAANFSNIELVYAGDLKWGYTTYEIDDDVFMVSTSVIHTAFSGSYAFDVFLLSDSCSTVTPAYRYYMPTGGYNIAAAVTNARFPNKPCDNHAGGYGWMRFKGANNSDWLAGYLPVLSLPCTLTKSGTPPQGSNTLLGHPVIGPGSVLRMGEHGDTVKIIERDLVNNRIEFRHGDATGSPRIRFYAEGEIAIMVSGQIALRARTSTRDVELRDNAYNLNRLKLGDNYLWVDSTGKLRIKASAPTSDTDGTVVGTQS